MKIIKIITLVFITVSISFSTLDLNAKGNQRTKPFAFFTEIDESLLDQKFEPLSEQEYMAILNLADQITLASKDGVKYTNKELEAMYTQNLSVVSSSTSPIEISSSSYFYEMYFNIMEMGSCVWNHGVQTCATAKSLADQASLAAQNSGYTGAHNGKQDTYRHAYWNMLMCNEFDCSVADNIATNHEVYGDNPYMEEQMDLWNNYKGRQLYGLYGLSQTKLKEYIDNYEYFVYLPNGPDVIYLSYTSNDGKIF